MKNIKKITLVLSFIVLLSSASIAQTSEVPPKDADTPIANRTAGNYSASQAIINLLTQLIIKVI